MPDSANELDALDSDVPLLLLPVRLQTRFALAARELRIRVLPDQVQVTAHAPGLTDTERQLKASFDATADKEEAFAWLVRAVGAPRALYLAELERDAPATTSRVPRARMLPRRWHARVVVGSDLVLHATSREIPEKIRSEGLPVMLGLDDVEAENLEEALAAQGLAWLRDFEAAEDVGMAIRVELTDAAMRALDDNDSDVDVTVVGVMVGDADTTAEALGTLFEQHRYDAGLALLDADTPTNQTSAVNPTLPADPRAFWRARRAVQNTTTRRAPAGAALSWALGLAPTSTALRASVGAADRMDELAGAAHRALWPATMGYAVRTLLGRALPDGFADWLDTWSADHVRATGPLPFVRVGDQPYGVLPIALDAARVREPRRPLRKRKRETPTRRPAERRVERDVARPAPSGSISDGPVRDATHPHRERLAGVLERLRPIWLDAPALRVDDGADIEEVLEVLAQQPGPARFGQRTAEDMKGRHGGAYWILRILTSLDETYLAMWERMDRATNLDEQIAALGTADELIRNAFYVHRDRIALARTAVPGVPDTFYNSDDPTLFHMLHDPEATEVIREDRGEPLVAWLEAVLAGTDSAAPKGPLARVLAASLARDTSAELREALALLASEARRREDPDWLVRTLRHSLGTSAARFDAWSTALATDELDKTRARRRSGIGVGAVGWVGGLRPRERRKSQGFVATPDLASATTAAVLRNAWSAFGDQKQYSLAAVDLSSSRVRRASWILDGVRSGRALAEVLGLAIEQKLSTPTLAKAIAPLRDAVGSLGPHGPVDGDLLARAFEDPPPDDDARGARTRADAALAAVSSLDAGAARAAIQTISEDLDAVADLLLAEGIHTLTRGQAERASAWLAAQRAGDAPPPQIGLLEAAPSRHTESHTLGVLVEAAEKAGDGWAFDDDARRCPPFEGLARTLLGPAKRWEVVSGDRRADLTSIGISASRALWLAGKDSGQPLRTLLAERLDDTIDATARTEDRASIADLITLARAAFELLAGARVLGEHDLALHTDSPPPPARLLAAARDGAWPSVAVPDDVRDALGKAPRAQIGRRAWLRETGEVRVPAKRLADLLDLSEALGDETVWSLARRGLGRGERQVLTLAHSVLTSGRTYGFVVDAWSEALQDEHRTLGIAAHFDAPKQRAPQVMILGVPSGAWSRDRVLALADEARAIAQMRSVSLERLEGVAQFLPAIYLPEAT